MGTAGNLEGVARLIQLAVAPIFLLTAVATTLLVLAGRLARIVDRGRFLEAQGHRQNQDELVRLESRARLIYYALTLGVVSALLVCFVMTAAFLGELFEFNPARPVAVLFIASLFTYTAALFCLLREVFLAVASFRLGLTHPPSSDK